MSAGATPSILVCAASTVPTIDVDAALAPCGLAVRRVTDLNLDTRASAECHLALVSWAWLPKDHASMFEELSRLKGRGYTVFCCAPSATTWPLALQCRLLLAGASHIFDSTAATFANDLRDRVTCHVNAGRTQRRDDQQLTDKMRELGLIGTGPGIVGVFRDIVRFSALSDLPVLISGETGTGKELVARSIHRLDPQRRNEPFIPVNCAAISAGLAESQLFGHRRGAFTGADHDRAGLIRAARGGVLFLDEIGDLDPNLQGKLLRVLQERRVLAVGDDHEVPVGARIIAATNRNLGDMVRGHAFRSDLYHRLNVLSLHLPPLRDRPEDIALLVQHFITKHATPTPVAVGADFVQALGKVDLPGNVRELENVVGRAIVTRINGEPLALSSLPPELWQQIADEPGARPRAGVDRRDGAAAAAPSRGLPLFDAKSILRVGRGTLNGALSLCEHEILSEALRLSNGNRSRAARQLGISARSIFNKLRKHGLAR
jgi:transcriptional regulator with GAF, ATPase, and Fis domain